MNLFSYTFNNCTLEDAAGHPHMLVPLDMCGIPCFPGDIVCDECDTDCKNPFVVAGIGAYDGSNTWSDGDPAVRGAHTYVVSEDGEQYFSDEVFHVNPDPYKETGWVPCYIKEVK